MWIVSRGRAGRTPPAKNRRIEILNIRVWHCLPCISATSCWCWGRWTRTGWGRRSTPQPRSKLFSQVEEVFQRLECTVLQRTSTVEVRIYYCERKSALKMEELMYKYRAVHKASESRSGGFFWLGGWLRRNLGGRRSWGWKQSRRAGREATHQSLKISKCYSFKPIFSSI